MEVIQVTNKDWLKTVHSCIVNHRHCIAWGIQDTGVVLVPKTGIVDEQLCYDMGYMVYESFNLGAGAILTNAGDFEIGHFGVSGNPFLTEFTEYFTNWLISKGLNATYENNDILVDGYKVCGTCATRYTGIDYTGVHIGINTNLEDIKKICTKPMNKIPKGLSEYGITTEEVRDMFLEFCKYYDEKYDV